MKIAIIGSGNVGGALAQSLVKAGHTVLAGVRFPLSDKSRKLMEKIGEDRFTTVLSAVHQCDVVVITIPPDSVKHFLKETENLPLVNKVFIDATNSITKKPEGYATVYHQLRAFGIKDVAKCFNTTGFENMLDPVYPSGAADMFCAGHSEKAKDISKQLSKDIGFGNCYDFGGDDKVELLEQLALCWINLAIFQRQGRNLAFRVMRR